MTLNHTTADEDTTITNMQDLSGILDKALEIIARLDKKLDDVSNGMDDIEDTLRGTEMSLESRAAIIKIIDKFR
jgi:phosphoenolpyruvate synthase/pyruvate phosphate dikinase